MVYHVVTCGSPVTVIVIVRNWVARMLSSDEVVDIGPDAVVLSFEVGVAVLELSVDAVDCGMSVIVVVTDPSSPMQ